MDIFHYFFIKRNIVDTNKKHLEVLCSAEEIAKLCYIQYNVAIEQIVRKNGITC